MHSDETRDPIVTAEAPAGISPDSGYAPETWAFDDEVTRVFDDMLRRSIPQYDVMRETVFRLGDRFVAAGSNGDCIMDLGASRGEAIAPFVKRYGAIRLHTAIEVSPPMLKVLRERFAGMMSAGVVEVLELDLRGGVPHRRCSLILSVLALQFIPIEYRQRIVRSAYKALKPGGAMIVVEKVLGDSAELDEILVDEYQAMKLRAGYTQEEIDRKALSLEGVLVPVTAKWNEELLRRAGFDHVDCFWRWANFAGWLAIREGQ